MCNRNSFVFSWCHCKRRSLPAGNGQLTFKPASCLLSTIGFNSTKSLLRDVCRHPPRKHRNDLLLEPSGRRSCRCRSDVQERAVKQHQAVKTHGAAPCSWLMVDLFSMLSSCLYYSPLGRMKQVVKALQFAFLQPTSPLHLINSAGERPGPEKTEHCLLILNGMHFCPIMHAQTPSLCCSVKVSKCLMQQSSHRLTHPTLHKKPFLSSC